MTYKTKKMVLDCIDDYREIDEVAEAFGLTVKKVKQIIQERKKN